MMHLPASVRVYLCTTLCDMRRSFDGLHALVTDAMQLDAFGGHLFVFSNRRRDRIKIRNFLFRDFNGCHSGGFAERGCECVDTTCAGGRYRYLHRPLSFTEAGRRRGATMITASCPSLAAAILDVIKLLAEDWRYTPYKKTSDIYSVYDREDPNVPSPRQRTLDTIFQALGGDVSNIPKAAMSNDSPCCVFAHFSLESLP
jgi:hypothetical protein